MLASCAAAEQMNTNWCLLQLWWRQAAGLLSHARLLQPASLLSQPPSCIPAASQSTWLLAINHRRGGDPGAQVVADAGTPATREHRLLSWAGEMEAQVSPLCLLCCVVLCCDLRPCCACCAALCCPASCCVMAGVSQARLLLPAAEWSVCVHSLAAYMAFCCSPSCLPASLPPSAAGEPAARPPPRTHGARGSAAGGRQWHGEEPRDCTRCLLCAAGTPCCAMPNLHAPAGAKCTAHKPVAVPCFLCRTLARLGQKSAACRRACVPRRPRRRKRPAT